MSSQTESSTETLLGGWTQYHNLSQEDKIVFEEALEGFVGVEYTPQEVSTQVVAGTNYKFKCTAQQPPLEVIWQAIVEIYKPLGQKPVVTGIFRI